MRSYDHNYIAFEERAALMEYDGGLSRAEAERRAWEILDRMSKPAAVEKEKPRPEQMSLLGEPEYKQMLRDFYRR